MNVTLGQTLLQTGHILSHPLPLTMWFPWPEMTFDLSSNLAEPLTFNLELALVEEPSSPKHASSSFTAPAPFFPGIYIRDR